MLCKAESQCYPICRGKLVYVHAGFRNTLRRSLRTTLAKVSRRASHPLLIAFFTVTSSVLQQNPLQPPRPFTTTGSGTGLGGVRNAGLLSAGGFVSAEDFDATGILAGVDPCESRYWWVPELYGPEASGAAAARPSTEGHGRYAAKRPSTSAAA